MRGWGATLDNGGPSRRTRTRTRSRGVPDSIVLGHYGGRPVAPSTRRTRRPAARRGARGLPAAAASVTALSVPLVLQVSAVEPGVDFQLILTGHAILANARGHLSAHEPYRVLDELHRGAEDGVRCTVEIRIRPRVGRIRFDALLV